MAEPSAIPKETDTNVANDGVGLVTNCLKAIQSGEPDARDKLLDLVVQQVRKMAGQQFANERVDHTLQPTAIVNEVWIRLFSGEPIEAKIHSTKHLCLLVARTIRRVLIDHARGKTAEIRGGQMQRVEFHEDCQESPSSDESPRHLAIHDALLKLESKHPEHARLVELSYFGGYTQDELAEILDVDATTVSRRLTFARAILATEIEP